MAQLRTIAFRTVFLPSKSTWTQAETSLSKTSTNRHFCLRYSCSSNSRISIPRSYKHSNVTNHLKSHQQLSRYTPKCQIFRQRIRLNVQKCKYDAWRTICGAQNRVLQLFGGRSRTLLAFLAFHPVEFIKRKLSSTEESALNEEILAHIPKEVFSWEPEIKVRKKRGIVRQFLHSIWRALRYIWRFVQVLCIFTPILLLYPMIYISDGMQFRWWRILLAALEFSGPTFIKLGQWASTRRDLFPDAFCDLFAKLHSSTRVHSWYLTQSKLRKAFGKNWQKIFAKVEKRPVGSGCIAQVHKAWMRVDMIPDESIVEEVVHEMDDHDDVNHEVDFAEGVEILGFGAVLDAKDDAQEYIGTKISEKLKPASKPPPEKTETVVPDTDVANAETPSADAVQTPAKKRPQLLETRRMAGTTITEIDGDQVIPVAIKVLHPNILRGVARDLSIIRSIASVVEKLFPSVKWLSIRECIDEFSDLMMRQIDLRHESRCLEKFIDYFEDVPYIRFPKPIQPYCKRDVLVETFEEGEPIMKFIQDDSDRYPGLNELLAGYGAEAIIQMIFVDNLVHGDLHPGNIIVQNADHYQPADENKMVMVDLGDTVIVNVVPVENPVRLVMMDTGITTSLTEQDLENLRAVFTAVILGEGDTVAELMLQHARHNDCHDVDLFKKELGEIVNVARENTIKLGKVQVGVLLSKVFSVLMRHHVKLESNFISIMIALFVLEGLGRSLDPELDILDLAKPVLLHR